MKKNIYPSLYTISWDERREIAIPGERETTLQFSVDHFIQVYQEAIQDHGCFFVALSGGSTPKAIFEKLCTSPYLSMFDGSKMWIFWSDERAVPPEHLQSNYRMAMEAGFNRLSIPSSQIFRMHAEEKIQENGKKYEESIKKALKTHLFDLIMLGMGEDGHTASLFPYTEGLKQSAHYVQANFIPQKNEWRMTMTFEGIHHSRHIAVYVIGESKKEMVKNIFLSSEQFDLLPAQKIGNKKTKALWILDKEAAEDLLSAYKEMKNRQS